ncbi:FCD domain-containing protein [Pseudomonas sp. JH-2]|uniref:FCD domain-containing protein n=1 Tax=Pseudomonas sp. JH-2 TaxID=3114998 RepID=UPI002E265322|nr:FCD domain-containing protein [Pseudomonas sp. JH-2]
MAAPDLLQRAVTRLAAIQRNDEDLERIRAAETAYMTSITSGDFQAMTEPNKALHMEISRAGKNPCLTGYYERLLGEGQRLSHLYFDFIISAASADSTGRDHAEIVEAIAARDADAAEKAAHEHTMLFQRRFLDFMQQNLTSRMKIS